MAVAGRGVALLPDFVCKTEVAAGELRAIPSPHWGFIDDVQIVTLERRGVSAKLRAFVDTLVEVVGDRAA